MGGFGSDQAYRNKSSKYDVKKNYSDDDQEKDDDEKDTEYQGAFGKYNKKYEKESDD